MEEKKGTSDEAKAPPRNERENASPQKENIVKNKEEL